MAPSEAHAPSHGPAQAHAPSQQAASSPETGHEETGRPDAGRAETGQEHRGDAHARQRPQLQGYLALIGLYNGIVAVVLLIAKRSGRLGPRPRAEDLLLAGLAVQRLSRLITKDRVTSAIRAPFTAYEGEGGPGEVEERARGRGLRKALGELLVCPFCIAQWLAAAFMCGLLFAPRVTRWLAGMFGVVAIADVLQLLYKRIEDLAAKE